MTGEEVRRCDGYTMRISEYPDHLRIAVGEGNDSLAVAVSMWRNIVAECLARGHDRCLIVESLDGEVAPEAVSDVVDVIMQAGGAGIRFAAVETRQFDVGNEHCEIEGLGRGLDWRLFIDEPSAVRWLRYRS